MVPAEGPKSDQSTPAPGTQPSADQKPPDRTMPTTASAPSEKGSAYSTVKSSVSSVGATVPRTGCGILL